MSFEDYQGIHSNESANLKLDVMGCLTTFVDLVCCTCKFLTKIAISVHHTIGICSSITFYL